MCTVGGSSVHTRAAGKRRGPKPSPTDAWRCAVELQFEGTRGMQPRLELQLLGRVPEMEPGSIANVLYGYGLLRAMPSPPMVQALLQGVRMLGRRMSPEQAIMVIWALARLRMARECRSALELVREPLLMPGQQQQLGLRHIADLVWAFAELPIKPDHPVLELCLDQLHNGARQFWTGLHVTS